MRTFTPFELWHGRDEPPVETLLLHAGPVTALLDGQDLRYVRGGGLEVVRRLYVAVRDHNWNTIPGVVSNLRHDIADDHFQIQFDVDHLQNDIAFSWHGEIAGSPNGVITCSLDGVCGSDFRYNRIGFCVLHPTGELAEQPYRGQTPHGPIEGIFPQLIDPQRIVDGTILGLFPAVESLTVDLLSRDGGQAASARFDFEGDLFEMEDQRNWTDASFKTYCTSLAEPWPKEATAGHKIRQRVTISLEGASDSKSTEQNAIRHAGAPDHATGALDHAIGDPDHAMGSPVRLEIGGSLGRSLPAIGLGMASHGQALTEREIGLLRNLRLDHLRADLQLSDANYIASLDHSLQTAEALDCNLELALFLTDAADSELTQLASSLSTALAKYTASIARVLVYHIREAVTSGQSVSLARLRLRKILHGVPFVGGTNANFCELNRNRPQIESMDAVAYSINPQVHAFDETSLVETIQAQPDTVLSARAFSDGLPIVVSPITLKPRFNPNATGAENTPSPDQLPTPVDPRQMSLFGAAWTLGSIKSLAESNAASLTYYETTGWRGVMETEAGPALPKLFPSASGMVFPLYHILADIAEAKSGEIILCHSSDPLAILGLAMRVEGGLRILLTNLTPAPRQVSVGPIPGDSVKLRRLNAGNAQAALFSPGQFRSEIETITANGQFTAELAAYETVRIDA